MYEKQIIPDDEPIDTFLYNKNTVNMVMTKKDMNKVKTSKDTNNKICIQNAFRHLNDNNILKFRKLINDNKKIVNLKHKKTYLIHEACKKGMSDFVKILLFAGANCNTVDSYGKYPQHYSIESNCCVLIDIIFLFGYSMDVQDSKGDTPFHYASQMDNLEMITTLMIYRANPMVENNSSKYPIDMCTNNEIIDVIEKYTKDNF